MHPKLIVTGDGSHSLYLEEMDESYHSQNGAITESEHVFITNGLNYWLATHGSNPSIFEVGFGTGLNALLVDQVAKQLGKTFRYASIEKSPLTPEIWNQLNYGSKLEDATAFNELHKAQWDKPIQVGNLHLHKICNKLEDYHFNAQYDLLFYDAFAPSKQPEMWSVQLLKKCVAALSPNGIFVTYSAKGQLKRDLKSLGMFVESLPGPPGKFEMTRATKLIGM